MKRSEMVQIMMDELERWQDEDSKFGGGFKSCLSSILKIQEDAGMEPPERYNSPEGGFVLEWEKEDKNEKK